MYKTYNELIQEGVVSNSSELGKFLREGVIQKVNGFPAFILNDFCRIWDAKMGPRSCRNGAKISPR